MPITSTHPEYDLNITKWQKCRDAYDGEDEVKVKGSNYLPLLSNMKSDTDPKYLAYKSRALFYGAMGKTVNGLSGMALRKPITLEGVNKRLEYLTKDVTDTGIRLETFIKNEIEELLMTGRYAIMADRSDTGAGTTYIRGIIAENITNWFIDENGKLISVIIKEDFYEQDPKDKFKRVVINQYRELFIDENGYYQANLHTKNGDTFVVTPLPTPTISGKPLKEIPIVFVNVDSTDNQISKPPLLDMVNVVFKHYIASADLEHGRHLTARPTPYITGTSSQDEKGQPITIEIGSDTCLLLPEANCKAGFMEFTGTGLQSLVDGMKEKEEMIAKLGAKILDTQKKAAESSETARINKSGDHSLLVSIASVVEDSINQIMDFVSKWEGISETSVVEMNKDFLDVQVNPQIISALLQALQAGKISTDTFLYNLKKAELLPEDISIEDEKALIENETPDYDEIMI